MNKAVLGILMAAVFALGTLSVLEYQEIERLKALVMIKDKGEAAAREEINSSTSELRKLKETAKSQKVAIQQLEKINQEMAHGPAANSANSAEPDARGGEGSGGFMKNFAKMFSDPKMRESMRAQQAAGIQMIYGDLARELGLSPDEARQVLGLLADRQMEITEQGMKVMGNGNRKEAVEAMAKASQEAKNGYEEQIKGVLGDQRYAKFEDYEKSLGERMAMDQYQKQLSATGTPLDATQSQGLLAIMKEERARTANPSSNDPVAQAKVMESDGAMNAYVQKQEDMNRRVLDRARALLSPDQVLALENAQKQLMNMQQMGMKMGREMFKDDKK
jgi:hypothetical protein